MKRKGPETMGERSVQRATWALGITAATGLLGLVSMQAEAGGYWEHGELVAEALQRVAVLSAFAVTLQTSFWCIQGFAEAMLTEEEDMSRRMLGSGLAYLNLIISGVLLVL